MLNDIGASRMPVMVATHNKHKREEFRHLLEECLPGRFTIVEPSENEALPQPAETGRTFADNALIKARATAAATGMAALADDSGIAVDIMCGAPGIFSARWAGHRAGDEANRRLLCEQLEDIPDEHRSAQFVCAIALCIPRSAAAHMPEKRALHSHGDYDELLAHGYLRGRIGRADAGDAGFGYDPVFIPEGEKRTLAEFTSAEKNSVSHRRNALEALAQQLG